MKYRMSFCDPFQPEIIELGEIAEEEIMDAFKKTDWKGWLEKVNAANQDDVHFSPSLEIENKETKHGISISAIGDPLSIEFYIFYKRPKQRKLLLGLISRMDENYTTDIQGQTMKDALDCLTALKNGNYDFLDGKIK